MSLFNVMDVSSSALQAQSVRLNTVASNIANADAVSSSSEDAYRSRQPVFTTVMRDVFDDAVAGVRVSEVVTTDAAPVRQFSPEHPMADDEGYIYFSNVNPVAEMANMISASRSYQNSIEAMKTARQLMIHTLNIGR
ncbi:flagellar basal body rod protein FlgC [bacterium SCSIO 12696]|nr:flagellar basal body rod protein FlgC [bacterium SCSIO 12696]